HPPQAPALRGRPPRDVGRTHRGRGMSDTPPPPDAGRSAVRGPLTPDSEEAVRPLLRTLIELDDALRLATRQLSATRDGWPQSSTPAPPKGWARLLPFLHRGHAGRPAESEILGPARERLVAALSGLEMIIRRVKRALDRYDLEPIAVEGRPFDPETMEVLEAVAENARPPGEVVEEA